ncbi:MAG: AmmeMemoRadiSam system protein A [Phycisphaerae bacterium]|nr:AmmeMemoRadiSam system protein A [Phycisphaerae bacterium]
MNKASAEKLLALARSVVQAELEPGSVFETPSDLPDSSHGGAFVTLRNRGQLRGCMGAFAPKETLADTIESVARSAAKDPRFTGHPITAAEMGEIHIEISILTEPYPTEHPEALEIGKHGIWIQRGFASGCFLPQVAGERNWSAEEFLSNCCSMKAGLASDAWKDPETKVLLFTADIISEGN